MSKEKSEAASDQSSVQAAAGTKRRKKLYEVAFYHDWCKACGICTAFCPQQIILSDKAGKPWISEMDRCTGCRFCEIHCPDFAIRVSPRSSMEQDGDD